MFAAEASPAGFRLIEATALWPTVGLEPEALAVTALAGHGAGVVIAKGAGMGADTGAEAAEEGTGEATRDAALVTAAGPAVEAGTVNGAADGNGAALGTGGAAKAG
jgi:hypothetical protein